MEQWNGFKGTKWKEGVDTRDFIQNNYTEYRGDDSFLEGPTEATEKLWDELQKLNDIQFERNGVYDWTQKSYQLLLHTMQAIWIKIWKKSSVYRQTNL